MKVTERIKAVCSCFANEHHANFAICRASFAKSKERMRAIARFPVLKGPIRRQTLRAKQAGHFPLFINCPKLCPSHKDM
jgi:hypothetical protein